MQFLSASAESLPGLRRWVETLEYIGDIRQPNARYWRSSDRRHVEAACFCDGALEIDDGPSGCCDNREASIEMFRTLGCPENIVAATRFIPSTRFGGAVDADGALTL